MGDTPNNPTTPRPEDELIGELFDEKYRITRKLGGGGMGLVYEAHHEWMERRVALKVLRPNFIAADDYNIFLERFKREAQTASRITHPNAVTIYDFGIYKQMPYLAMQFIEGQTISQMIKAKGPLDDAHAAMLLLQVLEAVDAAHTLQIIHRDIKPDNIMVSVSAGGIETAHVLDFGIAKVLDATEAIPNMTLPGKTVGTPRYMSPEQVLAKTIDVRTDIYALGLVLYEMLSGDIPFKADSSMQLMFHHVNTAPLPIREVHSLSNTPKRLEQLVMKALQKDPEKRFQSVAEMRSALSEAMQAAANKTSITIPSFTGTRLPPVATTRGTAAAVASAAALGALLTIGYLVFGEKSAETDGSPPTEIAPAQIAATLTSAAPEQANSESVAASASTSSKAVEDAQSIAGDPAVAAGQLAAKPVAKEPTQPAPPESGQQMLTTPAGQALSGAVELRGSEASGPSVPADSAANEQATEVTQALTAAKESIEASDPQVDEAAAADAAAPPVTPNAFTEETVVNETVAKETVATESGAKESGATDSGAGDSSTGDAVSVETAEEITAGPKAVATAEDVSQKVAAATASAQPVPAAVPSEQSGIANTPTKAKAEVQLSALPVATLIDYLAGEDRKLREQAAVELQQRGKAPVPALQQTLETHKSPRARFWAVFILGKIRAVESTESIVRALDDQSGMVSETAKKALRAVNPQRADALLGPDPSMPAPAPPKPAEKPKPGFLGIF